jgi:hypothetical protein
MREPMVSIVMPVPPPQHWQDLDTEWKALAGPELEPAKKAATPKRKKSRVKPS